MHRTLLPTTVLALALCGCKSDAPRGDIARPDPRATTWTKTVDKVDPVPAGAPVVEVRDTPDLDFDWAPIASGLPAVSTDGELIALGAVFEDGDRGMPNLTVRLIDVASNRVAESHLVLATAELEKAFEDDDGEPAAAVDAVKKLATERAARASAALREHRWLAMTATPADRPDDDKQTVAIGDIELTYVQPRLTITAGGVSVTDRSLLDLVVAGSGDCPWEEAIGAIYINRAARALLVRFIYYGGHHCGSQDDRYLAFRLPK